MDHLELIVERGTVRIPSIFMFEHFEDVTIFLDRAKEANCTVIFENENVEVAPKVDDFGVRAKIHIYTNMIAHREFGNAYVRYLGNIDKMLWDNVDVSVNANAYTTEEIDKLFETVPEGVVFTGTGYNPKKKRRG